MNNKILGKNYENWCFLKPLSLTDNKLPNKSVSFCRFEKFFKPAGPSAGPDRFEDSGPVTTLILSYKVKTKTFPQTKTLSSTTNKNEI